MNDMTLTTDIETRDAIGLLSRRRFLQGLGVTTAGLALTTSWPLSSAFAGNPIGADDGILVFVILAGGNDGVNTIVPYGSGLYYDKRAGISIPAGSVLPIGPGVGLHPSLTHLHRWYEHNELLVVYHSDDHLLIRAKMEQVDHVTHHLAEVMVNTAVSGALKGTRI